MAKCANCKQVFLPTTELAWFHIIDRGCITIHKQNELDDKLGGK